MDKKKAKMTQKEMEQKFKEAVFDAISAKIPGCYIEETGFLVVPNAIRRRKPSAVSASDSNQNKS